MNKHNPSRKPAARTRSDNLLALLLSAVLIPALLMLFLAGGATASAQVVTNSADSGPGTLRSAITNAASGAVITFDPNLSGATITLNNTLTINTNLTIDASALPGGLQINGNQAVQIFDVASSTITVFLNSLTITNGFSSSVGGGIYNAGTLTLTNCTLSGNSATNGGAIYNTFYAMLALNQCTLSGNSALYGGGGVIKDIGGGGILNYGTLTLDQCTLSANSAIIGGGGIGNVNGTLALNQCTLSGNSATSGGGILNFTSRTLNGTATATITNTIVGGNSGSYGADINNGADIYYYATLTYGGSNLVQTIYTYGGTSTITGPPPLTNAPNLAPLGNYGGPTQTMPPLPGSPAIDAGSNDATNNFATDQRGLPRFVGPQVDIGAVEFQASPVVTNADSGPGSLRYAIAYVTNNATITFDPSLSGATITLSNTLAIGTSLTIDASALPGGLQINGNGSVQIFYVGPNITVFLNSLTITGGYTAAVDAGVYVGGGGIDNYGILTLTNCTLSGNISATDVGGGIFNDGTLTMNQCTLSGNSDNSAHNTQYKTGGGGIGNFGLLTLNQCTLTGNSATNFGGGIFNYGSITLNQCTLSGNSAEYGGGIFNGNDDATLTLNQCTLSGNSAEYGGGIDNAYTLTLNQCTLSGNSATGGGIFNDYEGTISTMTMTNTIVAGNSDTIYGADDIENYSATLTYGGSNLIQWVSNYRGRISTIAGPAPLTNAPDLAPLGNYGGPTQTMPPLPGSPAIGVGSVAANTFSSDQRGYSRTQNGLIDLGAVELQSPAANPPVLENITLPTGGGNGLQFTFTNAPAADFTVLTATNASLALTNWAVLGEVQQVAPGQYQFKDPQAATNRVRFYRVRSP